MKIKKLKTKPSKKGNYSGLSIHPKIDHILQDTKGILVYQESLMKLYAEITGQDLARSDIARRAIAKYKPGNKKSEEAFKEVKKEMSKALHDNYGIGYEESDKIMDALLASAGYGFNAAHAYSYSYITWETMWWKYHHPAHFYCELLNTTTDIDRRQQIIDEMVFENFEIQPPDVNISGLEYKTNGKEVFLPLTSINGVSELTAQEIINNQPYKDAKDFMLKVSVPANVRGILFLLGFGNFEDLKLEGKNIIDLSEISIGKFEEKVRKFFPRGKKKQLLNDLYLLLAGMDNNFKDFYEKLPLDKAQELYYTVLKSFKDNSKFITVTQSLNNLNAYCTFKNDNQRSLFFYNFILPNREKLEAIDEINHHEQFVAGRLEKVYVEESKVTVVVNGEKFYIREWASCFDFAKKIKERTFVKLTKYYRKASGNYTKSIVEVEIV